MRRHRHRPSRIRRPQLNDSDKPATKADLLALKIKISRESRKAERWMIGILVAYFFATLATVYFLIHYR
jgi:hypothetical protein